VEDLITDIQEKTGLSADKVLEVVTMVADYMKNALPEELVAQIATYLGEAASSPGDSASDVVASATDFASRAAGTTVAAMGTVLDAVTEIIPTPDEK
jgi:hypothetical protein